MSIMIFGELYSIKNHKRIVWNKKTKKPYLIKSDKSLQAEKWLLSQLQANKSKWLKMIGENPLYPLAVSFKIYRGSKGRWDYINLIQQISDLMVKAEYLPDDDATHFIPVFAPFEVDKNNPRCIIRLVQPYIYEEK